MQYLATVFVLFFLGSMGAFMIRLEQSRPGAIFFNPSTYNTIVGMHGILMIASTIIMISGPFGNFILPIMIGARDMAFPRLNALSYWLLFTAIPIFVSTLFLGGFQTGWTGFAPLADQGLTTGMDAYCFTILVFAVSTTLAAMSILTTTMVMRTRGMTWGRLPIFVWGVVLSVILSLTAFPSFIVSQIMIMMDRVFQTSFFLAATGLFFLVLVGTLWRGKIWVTVPMLFVCGLLVNFVIGGVTGIYLADLPTDEILHGGMFVTAHFHFTLVGAGVFGFFAGLYYWFPKMVGKRLDPLLGKLHFWLFEIGFVGTFTALFYAGLQGDPRWSANIAPPFATANLIASLFAILIAASVFTFIYNVIYTLVRGEVATADEWGAKTLEWTVPTPVPLENFEELPVVTSLPYNYGSPLPEPVTPAVDITGAITQAPIQPQVED